MEKAPNLPLRYKVIRKLGSGGSSDVFLAHDSHLKKDVAVKVSTSIGISSGEFKVLALLSHPNIVKVDDFGHLKDGGVYFTEEFIGGRDISSFAKSWGLKEKLEALGIVAGALSYLHSQGIVHGDLKPSNILVANDGSIKLVDFGLVHSSGGLSGTFEYMPPEVSSGGEASSRSDLYSLGVIFYELIFGKNPFKGKSVADTLNRHQKLRPDIQGDGVLEGLLRKLLEKNPDARLQSGEELVEILRRAGVRTPEPIVNKVVERDPLVDEVQNVIGSRISDKRFAESIFAGFASFDEEKRAACEISSLNQIAGREVWRWSQGGETNVVAVILSHLSAGIKGASEDRWQLFERLAVTLRESLKESTGAILIMEDMEGCCDFTADFLRFITGAGIEGLLVAVFYRLGAEGERLKEVMERLEGKIVSLKSNVKPTPHERIKKAKGSGDKEKVFSRLISLAKESAGFHDYGSAVIFLKEALKIKDDATARALLVDIAIRNADHSLAADTASVIKERSFELEIKYSSALLALGDIEASEKILLGLEPSNEKEKNILTDRLYRLYIKAGRYKDVAEAGRKTKDAVLLNTIGLAHYYLGEYQQATECFISAGKISKKGAVFATSANYLGMTAYNQGDLEKAKRYYGEALAEFVKMSHPTGRLSSIMNLAATHHLAGEYATAMKKYNEAIELSKMIGSTSLEANLHNNIANLYVTMKDLDRAKRELAKARGLERLHRSKISEGYNDLIDGDIHHAEGDDDKAIAFYERARDIFREVGAKREEAISLLNMGKIEPARLSEARMVAEDGNLKDILDSIAVEEAWHSSAAVSLKMTDTVPRELKWEIYHLIGEDKKAESLILWLAAQLPMDLRERYLKDRRRAAVLDLCAKENKGEDMQARDLRRLLDINKKMISELSTKKVLEYIMDSVVELTGADRGFLVLKDEKTNELDVPIARNFDYQNISGGDVQISRSIAERTMRRGEPILTTDAIDDERFKEAKSVHAMQLRSVMCAPLRHKGEVIGAIYVDNRYQTGLFTEDDLELMSAFADQAAIAYVNAKLYEDKERSEKEIAELNKKLESVVARQTVEIENITFDLASKQKDLELKYQYKNIIGKSKPMRSLFQLLDKITETESNVLITGESGTGKELVAKAIHYNGPRKDRPFVSINCAAIPSNLIESELFGHKKGSFTGAVNDKAGLFEQANYGTIFLDEIGELPLDMQAKLLRAIQEKEIRRVGANQNVKIDVRVISATNRELSQLVAEKKFREDLFYRLNVLPVKLPPLRDRSEDIPLLIGHFLEKYKRGGSPKEVSQSAMKVLMGHSWPGNVRELENEIERATIMSGDIINEDDISEHVRGGIIPVSIKCDGGKMKDVRGELEKKMIEEALAKCDGNKSKAAQLLGLSRYGLYKKMERFGYSG